MEELKKDISLTSGIAQLSTTLMGTGLFMIPAIAAGIAGHFSLWAWILLFIAICPIALTFAQLGKRYPNAGGTAFFVRKAFNAKLESSVAWLFVSVIPVGVPAADCHSPQASYNKYCQSLLATICLHKFSR